MINELIYTGDTYRIDFDDLEKKVSDPKAKLLLLCSPHNPVGRVWTKDEINRIGEICLQNHVIVISDEIHCDLVFPEHQHIPFASVSDKLLHHSVTCIAPSKTFNLAGIQVANIIAADEEIRRKINKSLNIYEVCDINAFAIEALIAAYTQGDDWLVALNAYLYGNYMTLKQFMKAELPFVKVTQLEATYLVWLDFSALGQSSRQIAQNLMEKENLWVNEGTMYGTNGEGFIRLNIACPRALLEKGLAKIKNQYQMIL